jgi:hypothetical protein
MKRELPLTVSAVLVPRILDNSKTMTRRGMTPQPMSVESLAIDCASPSGYSWVSDVFGQVYIPAKYKVGDILYVREEHYAWGWWEDVEGEFTKTGKKKRKFFDKSGTVIYPDTLGYNSPVKRNEAGWHKRLARFMPKAYARIYLEVTGIRPEKLDDISEEDACWEGIGSDQYGELWEDYSMGDDPERFRFIYPTESFKTLWLKINGPGSWDGDKEKAVWVVSFKVLSTTGRPDNLNTDEN